MTSMNLAFNDCFYGYALTDSEAIRLSLAHDRGETLTFSDGEKNITLGWRPHLDRLFGGAKNLRLPRSPRCAKPGLRG